MTTRREYTVLIPRAVRAGPCNVAVDLGRAAKSHGFHVRLLYLSGSIARDDIAEFDEVRRWRWSDLATLSGVIHTHGLRPDLLGWLLSWGGGRTIVTTIHNHFLPNQLMVHTRWKVLLAWCVWSRALARFDYRVCVSQTMKRYYRRLLPHLVFEVARNCTSPAAPVADDRMSQIRNWIRDRRFGGLCLAYVGTLTQGKNVLRLLEAVAEAPGLSLVICGEGPLKGTIERRIRDSNLASRVLCPGHLLSPDQVMAECDMLVLPSLTEGLPLVVLEAARVGRPSLLSNIAVHRELARLGLGATFDRHAFADFAAKAEMLVSRHGPGGAPDSSLVSLWERQFSAAAGFERYARLLTAS